MKHVHRALWAAVISMLFFSCEGAGLYLTQEERFSVQTLGGSSILQDGAWIEPGATLSPELAGLDDESMQNASLIVLVTPVLPAGRAVGTVSVPALLARYATPQAEASAESAAESAVILPAANPVGNSGADGENDTAGEIDTDTDSEGGDDTDSEAPPPAVLLPSPGFKPLAAAVDALSGVLPAFSLPRDMPAGPCTITYQIFRGTVMLEERIFRFFCMPEGAFDIDTLIAYPPGPDTTDHPVIAAGSVALFELAGDAPDTLDPCVKWFVKGKEVASSSFAEGAARLLHTMPDEDGLYTLKVALYPVDPGLYPGFPLSSRTRSLTLAVSSLDSQAPIPALEGAGDIVLFPLRGSLESREVADFSLRPLIGGVEATWMPLLNDFGLLAGPGAAWYTGPYPSSVPLLADSPLRVLWDGAVLSEGLALSGSVLFEENVTLTWQLSFLADTALLSFSVPGEEEPLLLALDFSTVASRARFWCAVDIQRDGGKFYIRATLDGGDVAYLSFEAPAGQPRLGPLVLGEGSGDTIQRGRTLVHHLALASIPGFLEEMPTPQPEPDDSGEYFLEI